MDMFNAARITALLGAAALVSACASTKDDAPLVPPPASMNAAASDGTIPDYCPRVSLREGTAILRKGDGAALQYVASITSTTRDCRIVDGQLRMKIGVYSQIGSRAVTVKPGGGAEPFVYVDQSVAVPEPTEKDITVYAGFDEGPKK
jgi:hypothetical protein